METIAERSRLADRVLSLLERVEYRRADTREDKAAIFRMRYEAYTRAGTIEARSSGLFDDPFDEAPNVWLIGVFLDGELASSLRLHISASVNVPLPAMVVYPDILTLHLQAGRMIIDPSRFAVRLEYSQEYPEMPYITLRPAFLAEAFFDADFISVACRVEHQAFYRRIFGCVPWAAPREYPNFNRPMALLGYDCKARRSALHTRYPFYQSGAAEQTRLFERSSKLADGAREAIHGAAADALSRL